MKRLLTYISATMAALSLCLCAAAQEKIGNGVEIDRTVYNFGDVYLSAGPLECSFTVKNTSSAPIAIYSVVSSCGCTNVDWTREPLQPGKTGKITATYSNDEGPYPFDKSLSVYISSLQKPLVLRIRGVAHEREMALEERFPEAMGPIAFKTLSTNGGNMEQGNFRSDEIEIANISKKTVKVDFKKISPELTITPSTITIPAKKTAKVKYTVKASRENWGKTWVYATPSVAGVEYSPIGIWTITKENFSNLTKEQKDNGSRPVVTPSTTYSFSKVKAGKKVQATFTIKNTGKTDFEVYKADFDFEGATLASPIPVIKPGQKATVTINLDTTGMAPGEGLVIVRLITNSPSRPLLDLFLAGWID
ncbi:MAG: DUF1573 domain-containing protein [Bacteroidales bacterium]|nr:DUF1573 domain-containing protein [Bacteroidales bacterium]